MSTENFYRENISRIVMLFIEVYEMKETNIRPYMYYVYILQSKLDKRFYIGFSSDIKRRLLEYKEGLVISTSKRRPLVLVMYEAYLIKKDAQDREKFF